MNIPLPAEYIAKHEGRRSFAYDDADGIPLINPATGKAKEIIGHPSVGIGCNLDRDGAAESLSAVGADYTAIRSGKTPMTNKQIDALFEADCAASLTDLRSFVHDFDGLPEAARLVLIDLHFNMGGQSLRQFRKGTIAAIESGDYLEAAARLASNDPKKMGGAVRLADNVAMLRLAAQVDQ